MLLIVVNLTLELLATFHRDICTGHTAAMAQILVVGLVGLDFFFGNAEERRSSAEDLGREGRGVLCLVVLANPGE